MGYLRIITSSSHRQYKNENIRHLGIYLIICAYCQNLVDYLDYVLSVKKDLTIKATFNNLKVDDKMNPTDSIKEELDKTLSTLEIQENISTIDRI